MVDHVGGVREEGDKVDHKGGVREEGDMVDHEGGGFTWTWAMRGRRVTWWTMRERVT